MGEVKEERKGDRGKMSSFGKLTDYFNLRKSREETRVGRSSRRSGSYCCTVAEARSLERKLQRPRLAKSRTLPSIPQSPSVSRVGHSYLIVGSPPGKKSPPTETSPPKACTLPSEGDLWRLEDDMNGDDEPVPRGCTEDPPCSQLPFSHIRTRAAYLRKSISADDHLDTGLDYGSGTAVEEKPSSGSKGKLKRKFSLGSADRKEHQRKSESSISKCRLSLKESRVKTENTSTDRPPSSRRRTPSVECADTAKMTQPPRGDQALQAAPGRKSTGLSSPSAARRLYRNLSGKFRVGTNPPALEDSVGSGRASIFRSNEALFEAVEHQELDLVQLLLSQCSLEELDLNTPNSEGLLPLDIAIMTNNVPMAKLLLRAGAKESPHFVSLEGRAVHLNTLVQEAEQRVSELQALAQSGSCERKTSEQERPLKAWEWRLRLFRRMLMGFEHANPPDAPSAVFLSVTSSTSLTVDFQEPLCVNSAVVTKYKVSWSTDPSFHPLTGETVLEDTNQLECNITGLTSDTYYYIQVSAFNMKGWGPSVASTPACAAPSSWRDVGGCCPRQMGQKEALDRLFEEIKESHRHCICHEQCKARKHSVSKSLRHLFQPTSKFVKTLKRGLYLASIFYRDDNVLVTSDDQLPIVEVEDSYSSSLVQDFLWFTKVSYLWKEIPWLQQCLSSSQFSCSCTLQTRLKILQAVSHLQGMLGTQDLGQVYLEPVKDKHGSALLVLLKDMNACPNLDGFRWTQLCKLQLQRKSISSPEEPSALDMLLITLHEKLAYDKRSRKLLPPGLYLGYLKLCTSVDQIKVLVPEKLPNVLCYAKMRSNSNVSRAEWQWLQALGSLEESLEMDLDVQSAPHRFLQDLRNAIRELMAYINVPGNQAQDFRIYNQKVFEFGENVSFVLLMPPSDEVCAAPGQNTPYSHGSGFLTLPLQIFELVHFNAYCPTLIGQYCRVSALLELESLLSQQARREAFSEAELLVARMKHQQVQEHMQQLDEVWRDVRWIMDALQHARYKQPTGGVSLSWIIDFSKEVLLDKAPSSSCLPDFMPLSTPSPDPCRKHSGADYAGLSDEEGSSEVFLTTDSDYDSSRAQSPRELDLLPPSPHSPPAPLDSHGCLCDAERSPEGRTRLGGGGGLRDGRRRYSTPDVLQHGREPDGCEEGVGRGGERLRGQPQLFDSDFILPSRQIELLHITEKRQAFCVRTCSLEFPSANSGHQQSSSSHSTRRSPTASSRPRWRRPSSVDRCCPGQSSSPQLSAAATLSEDSGNQRLSSPSSPSSAVVQKGCHTTLRVHPQYHTGLPKDTSVKLCVTPGTSAQEMVQLVVQEMNRVSRRILGGLDGSGGQNQCVYYSPDQLEHFGLVLVVDDREKWLHPDFCPLELQNPWLRGKLCVRIKDYSPLSLKQSHRATSV